LITTQAFSLGNFRGPLIHALCNAEVKVLALAPDYDDDTRATVAAFGATPVDCRLKRTGMNPLNDALDTLHLALLLRRLSPDIILGYTVKAVIFGTVAAWLARVPRRFAMIEGLGFVFSETIGKLSLKRRFLRRAVLFLYRIALARADRVMFLNPDDVAECVINGVVSREKASCLGGIGVDLAEWGSVPSVTVPVTFLLAARLLREKGIVEYITAARLVKLKYPEVRFILLGGLDANPGGLGRAEVEAWAQEGIVEWPGHVSVRQWLEQASVYVLPSYYREGVPRSTQEAMAMGRPVITTDSPGCRETVEQGVNGFMVPVRDASALEEAMLNFVRQPELIVTMGMASRSMAEAKFDVHKINAEIFKIMAIDSGSMQS
jgi:glycosyltransferase involved in cell wall biosynthesis